MTYISGQNSPNLKSIQIYGRCHTGYFFKASMSQEFMQDLCINKGIYVDIRFADVNQKWLDNYLKKQDTAVKRKYLKIEADLPKFKSQYEFF